MKEEKIDLKIKKEKNYKKIPKEISDEISKKIFENIIKAICIMIYFIVLNLAHLTMDKNRLMGDIQVFSSIFLLVRNYIIGEGI